MLNAYTQQVSRLCGDPKMEQFNLADLIIYINLARGQVAAEGQCVRFLTPISAGVASVAPVQVGSGYTSRATVTVTPPDLPGTTAAVSATDSGGQIISYAVTTAGSGYMFPPGITVSGGGGSGATATATLQYTLTANPEQEIYNFSSVPISTLFPGASQILAVLSCAVIWANFRYVGNRIGFSKYQALIRTYTSGNFLYTPFWFSQYGQGTNGSFYIYPLPDQVYPMEWDCLCLPSNLASDTDTEVIPYPFTDAVPFYAAWLTLSSKADPVYANLADRYFKTYELMMRRARAFAEPMVTSSWYGRNIS